MTTTPKHPHNGHRARLRQRARETGLAGLADHEVLELILTYAIPRVDTNRTAHRLIHTFGSLSGVLEARYEDLRQVEGVGENAATLLTLFPSLTRRYLLSRTGEKPLLNTSERAGEYGRALFADCRVETLYLLCLDVKCRLLQAVKLAEGTIDRVPVQNREIIRAVLSTQAKNVLMMHNHPSGSLRPTAEDYRPDPPRDACAGKHRGAAGGSSDHRGGRVFQLYEQPDRRYRRKAAPRADVCC